MTDHFTDYKPITKMQKNGKSWLLANLETGDMMAGCWSGDTWIESIPDVKIQLSVEPTHYHPKSKP
jgi:hypothetical protein